MRQLGAVFSAEILQGQYWRFGTGMLGHSGIGHLLFNLYALTIVGPLIEELYDRKKMLVIFIVGGVLSMVAEPRLERGDLRADLPHDLGASGGTSRADRRVSHRRAPARTSGARRRASDVALSVYMILFGLAVPGIDNAAHIGGWLVGAGLAAVFPLGLNPTVALNRVYSTVIMALLAGLIACVGFMLADVRTYGAKLEADISPRRFLFFTYAMARNRPTRARTCSCKSAKNNGSSSAATPSPTIPSLYPNSRKESRPANAPSRGSNTGCLTKLCSSSTSSTADRRRRQKRKIFRPPPRS